MISGLAKQMAIAHVISTMGDGIEVRNGPDPKSGAQYFRVFHLSPFKPNRIFRVPSFLTPVCGFAFIREAPSTLEM
jgi:hypothetical protein